MRQCRLRISEGAGLRVLHEVTSGLTFRFESEVHISVWVRVCVFYVAGDFNVEAEVDAEF